MKAHTNSKTLSLTLAATALVGALFAGNVTAMADFGHRYAASQSGEVQKTEDVRKSGMHFVGGRVGWIRIPGAAEAGHPDPAHSDPALRSGEVQTTEDARKSDMRYVGGRVGWIQIPGAAGVTRTVGLEGRVIEGSGSILAPKQGD